MSAPTPARPCQHFFYRERILWFDQFGDETDDPYEAVFASARCELCGRLSIDIRGEPRPGQLEISSALERTA